MLKWDLTVFCVDKERFGRLNLSSDQRFVWNVLKKVLVGNAKKSPNIDVYKKYSMKTRKQQQRG